MELFGLISDNPLISSIIGSLAASVIVGLICYLWKRKKAKPGLVHTDEIEKEPELQETMGAPDKLQEIFGLRGRVVRHQGKNYVTLSKEREVPYCALC